MDWWLGEEGVGGTANGNSHLHWGMKTLWKCSGDRCVTVTILKTTGLYI